MGCIMTWKFFLTLLVTQTEHISLYIDTYIDYLQELSHTKNTMAKQQQIRKQQNRKHNNKSKNTVASDRREEIKLSELNKK